MYSFLADLAVVLFLLLGLLNLGVMIKAWRWTRRHPLGADCRKAFRGPVMACGVGGLFVMLLITGLVTWFIIIPDLRDDGGAEGRAAAAVLMAIGLSAAAPALSMHRRFGSKANLVALLSFIALLPYALVLVLGFFSATDF